MLNHFPLREKDIILLVVILPYMICLFIDTSTDKNFVACLKRNFWIKKEQVASGWKSPPLVLLVADVMRAAQVSIAEVNCIAIGTGPGFFTGTRVGLIVAKSLAYAQRLPIIPFSSLELFAPLGIEEEVFYICADAKAGNIYYVKGEKKGSTYFFTPPQIAEIGDFRSALEKDCVVGSFQQEWAREQFPLHATSVGENWEHVRRYLVDSFDNQRLLHAFEPKAAYLRIP